MAAMQELRDGGSVAMLSAVNDLYELLTFNEVMQDISIKDTEILDNMKNAKEALESDKLTLESQRSELQSKKQIWMPRTARCVPSRTSSTPAWPPPG